MPATFPALRASTKRVPGNNAGNISSIKGINKKVPGNNASNVSSIKGITVPAHSTAFLAGAVRVDSSWQGGTCSTMTTHPFSFSLRNGVSPTGVKLATGPEDVTHLVLSSNTHCGAKDITHLVLSSNTHCGTEDVTHLVLSSNTHCGTEDVTHLVLSSNTHCGTEDVTHLVLSSNTHCGAKDVTHLVLSSNTHCGAVLSSNTHCGAEDVTHLVLSSNTHCGAVSRGWEESPCDSSSILPWDCASFLMHGPRDQSTGSAFSWTPAKFTCTKLLL